MDAGTVADGAALTQVGPADSDGKSGRRLRKFPASFCPAKPL